VAVASAGPYAYHFHLAPDMQVPRHSVFYRLDALPAAHPTASVRTLKAVCQTRVVFVIQVITLKLMVVMLLSIHVMTSHDHTCVQCVRNRLQGNTDSEIIYTFTVEKSCIHVLSVRNNFHLKAH